MNGLLSLEAFDGVATQHDDKPIGPSQGYDEGFAAGFEASQSVQSALTAELIQSIADRAFTYSEARCEVLRSLMGLIETIAATILPHCASVGFATEVSMILNDAISGTPTETLSITVHPNRHDSMKMLLEQNYPNVTVLEDTSLTENAAWIGQVAAEQQLNLDQILSEITQTLQAIELTDVRKDSHG